MIKKISTFILFLLTISVFSVLPQKALANEAGDLGKLEKGPYTLNTTCKEPPAFLDIDLCKEDCKSPNRCILEQDWCYYCVSESGKTIDTSLKNLGFWGRMGNGIKNLFKPKGFIGKALNAVVNLVKGGGGNQKEEVVAEKPSKITEASKGIMEYKKDEDPDGKKAEKTRKDLEAAIDGVDNMGDLLKMQSLIIYWCSKVNEGNHEGESKCREELAERLKKQGDKIKEKLLAEINENEASGETYKKMVQLRSILMAGTSASDEGTFFSTNNIKKVQAELKKKAHAWFRNKLNSLSLEEIVGWYPFALANTSASGVGEGLFEGSIPMNMWQYRARRLALQKMAEIDVCNPDKKKLKEFQDLLNKEPGCEKILGNKNACRQIMAGNLEAAYYALYNQDEDDESSNENPNKVAIPPECKKKTTGEIEEKKPVESMENYTQTQSATKPAPEVEKKKPVESIENNTQTQSPAKPVITPSPTIPVVSPTPSQPNQGISETPQTTPTTDEPNHPIINEPEVTPPPLPPIPLPVTEYEPEHIIPPPEPDPGTTVIPVAPIYSCDVNISSDTLLGWNYSLNNCNKSWSNGLICSIECGAIPPMYVFDKNEGLCNETAGGFIDTNIIRPCEPRPYPPPHMSVCMRDCLKTMR